MSCVICPLRPGGGRRRLAGPAGRPNQRRGGPKAPRVFVRAGRARRPPPGRSGHGGTPRLSRQRGQGYFFRLV